MECFLAEIEGLVHLVCFTNCTSFSAYDSSFLLECTIDSFVCNNGRCISLTRECDGADDCGDNSDEDHCNGLSK